ncbi:hypothetical protein C8F04DRAFT_109909 [Mycena alexandri]|uniref:Uncharacterized protein n=1 Tax=Mycena alexandri TaxID=1745969 RepID=A0AAD6WWX0_9AGAR|nr:hypothetical protein C8F04DRAFT_109909 [Mycena alexandri]
MDAGGEGGDVEMVLEQQQPVQAVESQSEPESDVDAGMYAPEDAFSEDDYGRMRRRSPLCIVSAPPASVPPPSLLMLAADPSGEAPQQQQQQHDGEQEQEQQGPRTDLVYEAPQVLSPYPQQQQQQGQQSDDLGPDPATRMNTAWGPWKIACRLRVWDVKNRYTGGLIRSLVAQEADDYFSARGLPHPDALLFMDEEYYDWELEESASEGDGSGEESLEGEGFELEPLPGGPVQQSFELTPNPNLAVDTLDADDGKHTTADGEEMDLGTGMGGVLSSFYVAPPSPTSPSTPLQHLQHPGFPPQMPLPLPPPPLASVRVPVLRHFFTDIAIAPAEGVARGRGTPVDPARKAAWGGGRAEEIDAVGVGRGTLERRQPHPRPRPHPMYLAMARSAEAGAYGHAGGGGGGADVGGGSVEGVADADLPPLPRMSEPGEPPMLPMRGLRDLVRSLRGDNEEDEGTAEERKERDRREMSEAFEPDEAVWQEFLKSVGVEGPPASASSSGAHSAGEAMDVDAQRDAMDADADDDVDDSSGGSGGTSGGVSLGLPPAHNSAAGSPSSSTGSVLGAGVGMGVEMGIGMFGMAMGAMGMGWFGGPASPPVAVPVGDGERERERESSLSFALGV